MSHHYLVSFLLKGDLGALPPAWLHIDCQDLISDAACLTIFIHHLGVRRAGSQNQTSLG